MKIYLETRNGSFFGMNALPEDTMQDKGGIKPCNVSLYKSILYLIVEKLLISYC